MSEYKTKQGVIPAADAEGTGISRVFWAIETLNFPADLLFKANFVFQAETLISTLPTRTYRALRTPRNTRYLSY